MKILNFGSLNLDYTYHVPHIVIPGETITSQELQVSPGGKGLNQSVALARAGARVFHAGLIGKDGKLLLEVCRKSGVDVSFLRECEIRSGNAIIQVDAHGQNSIILYPGANRRMTKQFADEVLKNFEEGDVLLLQNEINELPYMIDCAYQKRMKIILNPSPYDEALLECDLQKVTLFILNEVEGRQITAESEPRKILEKMRKLYPNAEFVLTLGADGSIYCNGDTQIFQTAYQVEAVDTTGAGDTFTGYFIACYYKENNPKEALKLASKASAIAVTKKGAAHAIPTMEEVRIASQVQADMRNAGKRSHR